MGYEDFGNLIVELYAGTCPLPALTATYTYATYADNKDKSTTAFYRYDNSSLPTYDMIYNTQCNSPIAASSTTAGTQDLNLATGQRIDLSGMCDAVVSVKANANFNAANGDCLSFAVYGNMGASYLNAALLLAVLSMLANQL